MISLMETPDVSVWAHTGFLYSLSLMAGNFLIKEFCMKIFWKLFGLITLAAIISFATTACDSGGSDGPSGIFGGTAPDAPTGVAASADTTSSITVTWNAVSGATSYDVYFEIGMSSTKNFAANVSGTTYTHTGLTASTTYYYYIKAKNSTGESDFSSFGYTSTPASWTIPGYSYSLTANIWRADFITNTTDEEWYSFTVSSGTTYRVWVNAERDGDGTKTGNVVIRGYYSDGTTIWTGTSSNDWTTPRSFTANRSGTVYIRVSVSQNMYAGTFGIAYSTSSTRPWPTYSTLLNSTWANGNLASGDRADWYQFSASSGSTYRIWWNDSMDGPTPKTKNGDVVVSAYKADGTVIFGNSNIGNSNTTVDNGWATSQTITGYTGMVYIRVCPYGNSDTYAGTYGIVYSTGASRPAVP